MTIRHDSPKNSERFDVCVIGSGAAGLAVALSCGAAGHTVVMLEAGSTGENGSAEEPVRILDPSVHAPLDVSTRRQFGGTTAAWGGLCVPYDPSDFVELPTARRGGWPIDFSELASWHAPAARFLDCGTRFEDETQPASDKSGLDTRQFGRLARRAMLGRVYRDAVARSSRIVLCLSTRATRLVCDATGTRIIGVDTVAAIGPHEPEHRITARHTVIAAGGLRTTRLLLDLARRWPRHFDAGRAPLGRYYMGHLTGEVATLVFRDPRSAGAFLYMRDDGAHWMQRRLKLAPNLQKAQELLGTAFTLRAPAPADHRHGDGALSAIALLASAPVLSRYRSSERWRESMARNGIERRLHLRNIVRRPGTTVGGLAAMVLRSRVENLPILVRNATGRYSLRYHAEQAPCFDSRIFVAPTDPDCLVVDYRYRDEDFDSIVRSHRLLDAALQEAGIGHLEYHVPPDTLHEAVRRQSRDGYHQIGTTRMSHAPHEGIVDRDCRVHGFDGLYVASASVFPTSGSANPTLAVVAMALRLADHLSRSIARECGAASLTG